METKDINFLGIIALVGAIFMVVGVFLNWVQLDFFGLKASATGWEVFSDGIEGADYTFVPLVSLICGIISLLLMIVPTFMNTEKFENINNILGIIALVLAIVVVIFGLLFYTQSWTVLMSSTHMSDYVQIGFWLTLVGAIITAVGGLMPIVKNKFMN